MNALIDIAAIRSNNPLTSVVGPLTKLRRIGGGWQACCPLHDDRTPSFTIFAGDEKFKCFGCGATGDVLDLIQQLHNVDWKEAVRLLDGGSFPVVAARPALPRSEQDRTSAARSIWQAASPIAGTPAETYLRARSIECILPETLRFARLRYPGQTGLHPCLVALVTGPDNTVGGIQRTFVREDGSGKADVPKAKLSLGNIARGAIRLAPVAADLIITGGLEDALSMQQMFGKAAWAATGEGNMASLALPSVVKRVTIGADADPSGKEHADTAATALTLQGKAVKIMLPLKPYKDFNAELMGASA